MENGKTNVNEVESDWPVCRGIRGATTVSENTADAILAATRELLLTMIHHNEIQAEDVACVYFTTTEDLNACFPAVAARQLGWQDVPLICGHEMKVPTGLPMCVRIMMHWNTTKSQKQINHIYLHDAISLRPDKKQVLPVIDEMTAPLSA